MNKSNIFILDQALGGSKNQILKAIMDIDNSFIICDPAGIYLQKTNTNLNNAGFQIKVINLENPEKSPYGLNIVNYLSSDKNISSIVNNICDATNESVRLLMHTEKTDEFWKTIDTILLEESLRLFQETAREKSGPLGIDYYIDFINNYFLPSMSRQYLSLYPSDGSSSPINKLSNLTDKQLDTAVKNCIYRLIKVKECTSKKIFYRKDIDLKNVINDEKTAIFIKTPIETNRKQVISNRTLSKIIYLLLSNALMESNNASVKNNNKEWTFFVSDDDCKFGGNNLRNILKSTQITNCSIIYLTKNIENFKKKYGSFDFLDIFDEFMLLGGKVTEETATYISNLVNSICNKKEIEDMKLYKNLSLTENLLKLKAEEGILIKK